MAARMERTRHAGIYSGVAPVFSYRLNREQRRESVRTLSEAQRLSPMPERYPLRFKVEYPDASSTA